MYYDWQEGNRGEPGYWQGSSRKKKEVVDKAAQALKAGLPFYLRNWNNQDLVLIQEAWPWMFEGEEGQTLCLKCEAWYSELTERTISQRWGAVHRTVCPKGHTVDSYSAFSRETRRFLESQNVPTLQQQARSRDQVRD